MDVNDYGNKVGGHERNPKVLGALQNKSGEWKLCHQSATRIEKKHGWLAVNMSI